MKLRPLNQSNGQMNERDGTVGNHASSQSKREKSESDRRIEAANTEIRKLEEDRVICEKYIREAEDNLENLLQAENKDMQMLEDLQAEYRFDPEITASLEQNREDMLGARRAFISHKEELSDHYKALQRDYARREDAIYKQLQKEEVANGR